MDQPDDRDREFGTTVRLVKAARGGDRRALGDLFSRYLPRVRQIVALRMGWRLQQITDIEDMVQQVLMRLLEGLDRFEARSEGAFRNWLARCVECEIVDHARHHGRKKRGGGQVRRLADFDTSVLSSSIFADHQPSPSELAQAGELAERIEEALLGMPEHQRELIILRAVCGMSFSEVAEEMRISREGTVRVGFSRAMKKLKELTDLP